jgi:Tol biopolymer transport system component
MSNGWNDQPEISSDGRFIAFVSAATDLTPEPDANGAQTDIYRFEVETQAIVRVNVDDHGKQRPLGASLAAGISGNGRFIAFTSSAPLDLTIPLDAATDRRSRTYQVYFRDMEARTTRLASRTPAGGEGNGASFRPAISDDGRVLAFVSRASDLVRTDRNRLDDVFRYEVATGRITLVSRSARGKAANSRSDSPALSADGRYVAFVSEASNLLCSARCRPDLLDHNLVADVFVADCITGAIVRLSGWDAINGPWWEPSVGPAVDATGRLVAFSSQHPIDDDDLGSDFDLILPAVDPRRPQ